MRRRNDDMSIRRSLYREFRRLKPEAFADAPASGIEIVTAPNDVAAAEKAGEAWLAPDAPPEWRETGVMYQDNFISLLKDPVRFPDGRLGTYVRIASPPHRPDSAGVLPILNGKFVFIRHYRHPTRRFHWEIPGGYGEPGATPDETARAELREELGAEALRLIPLGFLYADKGFVGTGFHAFAAEIASVGDVDTSDAIVEQRHLTIAETLDAVANGAFDDCITIAIILRYLAVTRLL
jgi:ADP-ribose pyrophosphatase